MNENKQNVNVPQGMRLGVAIVGDRNAGKSSLLNQLTGQEAAIVSAKKGTTTDAVIKAYELPKVGAVSFYDTAGLDDDGELGRLRVKTTEKVLGRADAVIYVIGKDGVYPEHSKRLARLKKRGVPLVLVFNYKDARQLDDMDRAVLEDYDGVFVSALSGEGTDELKEKLISLLLPLTEEPPLVKDLVTAGDVVMLVTPIDEAAPKGRMILPQVQVLRELLDAGANTVVVKETGVEEMLKALKEKPKLVITDSQVVKTVAEVVSEDIGLTTFSTLFARFKGNFYQQLSGAKVLGNLKDGDKVLIAEGCSHHITCNDIGRVKLPNLIKRYSGVEPAFEFTQGADFPEDVREYALVIMCGGCMLPRGEMKRRLMICEEQGVAASNYGMIISATQGVLERITKRL